MLGFVTTTWAADVAIPLKPDANMLVPSGVNAAGFKQRLNNFEYQHGLQMTVDPAHVHDYWSALDADKSGTLAQAELEQNGCAFARKWVKRQGLSFGTEWWCNDPPVS